MRSFMKIKFLRNGEITLSFRRFSAIVFYLPLHYCEGGFHDEPRFSFLNFNRLVESLQNFEYEYNYKKRN